MPAFIVGAGGGHREINMGVAAVSAARVTVDGFNASHLYVCNATGDRGLHVFVRAGFVRPGKRNRAITQAAARPNTRFIATATGATIKVKIDAKSEPVEHLARVASQVSQVAKHLVAFAQKRHELESPQGPQAALEQDESFLDLDLLKEFGLGDVAMQLEQDLRTGDGSSAEPASEDDDEQGTDDA